MTYDLKPTPDAPERPTLSAGMSVGAAIEDLRRRLVRYAVKLVWNRDDAEESVQGAFTIAMEKGVSPSDERFGPWMFRTVGNICLNERRKRKYEPLADWIEHDTGEDAGAHAERVERLNRLRTAIAALPEQQRIAIVLRGEQQMSYPDIASVMELSESAVRGYVHQARKKLAEQLT